MSANIETTAFSTSGGVGWTGQGVQVDDNEPIEVWMHKAQLGWRVRRHKLAMRSAINGAVITLKNHVAIVRDKDDRVYCTASPDYMIVQNAEILEFFRDFCAKGQMTIDTCGALRHGAIIWVQARLNHNSDIVLRGNDRINGRLLLANSHDGSLCYQGHRVTRRVVCENTLRMALAEAAKEALFRMRHSSTKDRREALESQAKKTLEKSLKAMEEFGVAAEKLSNTYMDKGDQFQFVYKLTADGKSLLDMALEQTAARKATNGGLLDLAIANSEFQTQIRKAHDAGKDLNKIGKLVLDAMVNSPGADLASAKGTAWGAVNAVTYYVDHVAGRHRNAEDREIATESAWFGARSRMKQDALELALQYSEQGSAALRN